MSKSEDMICNLCRYPGSDLRLIGCGCTIHAVSFLSRRDRQGILFRQVQNADLDSAFLEFFYLIDFFHRDVDNHLVLLPSPKFCLVLFLIMEIGPTLSDRDPNRST